MNWGISGYNSMFVRDIIILKGNEWLNSPNREFNINIEEDFVNACPIKDKDTKLPF